MSCSGRSRSPWRIALVASLLVSMTIVPVLAYWFLRSAQATQAAAAGRAGSRGDEDRVTRLQRGYLPVLRLRAAPAADHRAGRGADLRRHHGLGHAAEDRLPRSPSPTRRPCMVDQELPVGTRLSATSEAAEKVEAVLDAAPGSRTT